MGYTRIKLDLSKGEDMSIGSFIVESGKGYAPYVGQFVNHLPMVQMALYKITEDLNKVEAFTKTFFERNMIDTIIDKSIAINDFDLILGRRDLYKPCLAKIDSDLTDNDLDTYIKGILNKYILGLSTGVFHTTIRLAYGVEGMQMDPIMIEEVKRGLAYYITANRASKELSRVISGSEVKIAMKELAHDENINSLLNKEMTLGKKMHTLYTDEYFLKTGFIIRGNPEEKIKALLDLLIPAYYYSDNITILHGITGLHALIVLKDYFDDFSHAIDILTSSIIVHLLTTGYNKYQRDIETVVSESWETIFQAASDKYDLHTIKLTYTAHELDKLYNVTGLKEVAYRRIQRT